MSAKKVPLVHVKKRRATPEDIEIGRKVRAKRLDKGLSQSALAEMLGLTFQQVQKYEKGTNRISAGRLKVIAHALGMPVTFFMGEGPGDGAGFEFLQSSSALRLNKAYARIKERGIRSAIVILLEHMASNQPA